MRQLLNPRTRQRYVHENVLTVRWIMCFPGWQTEMQVSFKLSRIAKKGKDGINSVNESNIPSS